MNPTPVIAVHGGAGALQDLDLSAASVQAHHHGLRAALADAQALLLDGGSALDAVVLAVQRLEDCPLFNAGIGAVFTREGGHELDAAVMDGATLRAGAVAAVRRVRNPVLAARAVLDEGGAVLMGGRGAEALARRHRLALVPPGFFATPARRAQWQRLRDGSAADAPDAHLGTVGAVALDRQGRLAAATSTGGVAFKPSGRIGDSPLIGAGTYADDRAAVSCTGSGEVFIRLAVAHDLCARLRHGGATLEQAARALIQQAVPALGGQGGLIAVDRHGHLALPFNTRGMFRGHARGEAAPHTAIFA